jgi:uncharacterized repeat protein (TIGR04076 family)
MERIGYRIVGEVKCIKGLCSAGHKVGDTFELSAHNADGLCGFLYHDIFPYVVMLQFGGGFPPEWGNPDILELACMDRVNELVIELKRVRE